MLNMFEERILYKIPTSDNDSFEVEDREVL